MPDRRISRRLLGLVLLVLALVSMAPFAGKWLVVDSPRRSDIIVVLAGDFGDVRSQHGLALLRRGYARHLVLDASDVVFYGRTVADLAQTYVQNTAPDLAALIRVCSFHGNSTLGELHDVAPCIRAVAPQASTAIVVTSDFHTRRAIAIARRTLPQYEWSVAAAPDSFSFGTAWWRKREWAKTTLTEWQKLIW